MGWMELSVADVQHTPNQLRPTSQAPPGDHRSSWNFNPWVEELGRAAKPLLCFTVKAMESQADEEKHIMEAANNAANASCQMTALRWLMDWQDKQSNPKSPYHLPDASELRRAKPLVEALKQRNLWPWD
ncbi:MAG: hypothetical protein VYC91_07995 [Acidobacteriota bacterium]|nr:hypothetical protein [Acidobacteriota bacterium]